MVLDNKQFSHYRLIHPIGRGAMGEVYLAEDSAGLRQVAIKVVRLGEAQALTQQEADNRQRLFRREVAAIGGLDHAHILPLYDCGQEQIENSLLAYLVMPYRAEGSLLTWLRRRAQDLQMRQLTLAQVTHLVEQAASALQYAHEHQPQIIHRDVKPTNFLIRSQGSADAFPDLLLADFGIARLEEATATSSNVVGTPAYMPPEQWAGQAVPASDQYALAIMTYELLTGGVPFQGSVHQVMYAHLQESPLPPSQHNKQVSVAMDTVLLKALAKQPEQRYRSMSAFARAWATACAEMDESTIVRQIPTEQDITSISQSPSPRSSDQPISSKQEEKPREHDREKLDPKAVWERVKRKDVPSAWHILDEPLSETINRAFHAAFIFGGFCCVMLALAAPFGAATSSIPYTFSQIVVLTIETAIGGGIGGGALFGFICAPLSRSTLVLMSDGFIHFSNLSGVPRCIISYKEVEDIRFDGTKKNLVVTTSWSGAQKNDRMRLGGPVNIRIFNEAPHLIAQRVERAYTSFKAHNTLP